MFANTFDSVRKLIHTGSDRILQITEELMNDCLGKNIFTGLLLLACFEKKNVYVLVSVELLGFGRVDSYRLENSVL